MSDETENTNDGGPEVTQADLDDLRTQLEAVQEENQKLRASNKTLQSTADQRAARLNALQKQVKKQQTQPPRRYQQQPLPEDEEVLDEEPDTTVIEAALLRHVVNNPELESTDIEGWESKLKDIEDVDSYVDNILLRKKVSRLEKGQEPPEEEEESTPPQIPVQGDPVGEIAALSGVFGASASQVRSEVETHLSDIDAEMEKLRGVDKRSLGGNRDEQLAARAIELAHSDPRKLSRVKRDQ